MLKIHNHCQRSLFYWSSDWHFSLLRKLQPPASSEKTLCKEKHEEPKGKCAYIDIGQYSYRQRELPQNGIGFQSVRTDDLYKSAKPLHSQKRLQSQWPVYVPKSDTPLSNKTLSPSRNYSEFDFGLTEQQLDHLVYNNENGKGRRKRKKSLLPPRGRYILSDEYWAKKVVKKLKTWIDFQDHNVTVVECNPASGTLTRSLLMRSKLNVVALNYRQNFSPELKDLSSNRYYKNRLHLEKGNILQLRKVLKKIGQLEEQSLSDWKSDSPIKIIGTTFPASDFPQYTSLLSYDLETQSHLYSLGRLENFLFVPSTEEQILGESNKDILFNIGTLRSALYKVFFDVKILMKIPSEAFGISNKNNNNSQDHNVCLIRLVPKSDLYEICSQENITGLIHLLKDLRKRRGQTLQTFLECVCPDLGPFPDDCLTLTDHISSLSVAQVLHLHKALLTRPNYLPFSHQEDTESLELVLPTKTDLSSLA